MSDISIRDHITKKTLERENLRSLALHLEEANLKTPFRDDFMRRAQAMISSEIAGCDISIKDHTKLL